MKTKELLQDTAIAIMLAIAAAGSSYYTAHVLQDGKIKELDMDKEVLTRTIEDMNVVNEYQCNIVSDLLIIQKIMDDGATLIQAKTIIEASNRYNIDPVLISVLIKSESAYKRDKHSLKGVIGLCGINTNVWKDLPFNVYLDSGNIEACAYILNHYLEKSDYDYLKAITKYKSNTNAGYLYALEVMKKYEEKQ